MKSFTLNHVLLPLILIISCTACQRLNPSGTTTEANSTVRELSPDLNQQIMLLSQELRLRQKSTSIDKWLNIGSELTDTVFIATDTGIVPRKETLKVNFEEAFKKFEFDTLSSVLSALIDRRDTLRLQFFEDNRKEICEEENKNRLENSSRVVAIFDRSSISSVGSSKSEIKTNAFISVGSLPICNTETFLGQPSGGIGTGIAINKSTIVTAAHCIEKFSDSEAAQRLRFIFDFRCIKDGKVIVDNNRIFSLKSIIKREKIPGTRDYALLLTDRDLPVPDKQVRMAKVILPGDSLYVIGHPLGLPLKIADGATVIDRNDPNFLSATLDTYAGNSGSPVFNGKDELVGILARGGIDMRQPVGKNCAESIVCTAITNAGACQGEKISRVSQFVTSIPLNRH